MEKYIAMLDQEIGKLIEKESKGFTEKGEAALHHLFENRKHAKRWKDEMHGMTSAPDMDNPRKSYFGGM